MELLKIQVYQAYQHKWEEFLKNPGSSNTVEDFKKSLSTKSLPNKMVSNVHVVMEKELGDIQPGWTHNVIARLRQAKQLSTTKYIKSFCEELKKKLETAQAAEPKTGGSSAGKSSAGKSSAGKSSAGKSNGGGSSGGKSKNDEPEVDDDKPTGSEAGGAGADGAGAGEATGGAMVDPTIELRSVSHSLKAIIHPRFDHGVFLGVITKFQANCHSCIRGLSKAVDILVDLVLAGQHATQKKMSFFDIKAVDLFDCGLSKSVNPIAIIDDISASV
ncbi:uncharacterized protein ATC70_005079 [Mucor velutinosus]|uniref:Uncharacterized protein n=1 Tax=Mucor velutinosus TaxID=708070 RepID=A0AAN7D4J5_9FUNG|nr:hypothetical protein ATC70_005079 [Mucor velutinosus]